MYKQQKKDTELLHVFTKWICDLVTVVLLTVVIYNGYFTSMIMVGHSMTNPFSSAGIRNDDEVMLDRIGFKVFGLKRYDVIAFTYEKDSVEYSVIKRVIALPGETVKIEDGNIFINGKRLEDDVVSGIIYSSGIASVEHKLAKGEYFVLGDNRNNSEDSRNEEIGMINKNHIIGKVWFVKSPVEHVGFVK